jgi:hypothetical protein
MKMTPEELELIDRGLVLNIGRGGIHLLVDALSSLVYSLDHCVGRDPHRKPNDQAHEPNCRLNGLLKELRWISLKASGMRDHRSKKLARVLALLHELYPAIVPEKVSPSTIRDVWTPRPRKRVRKL